MKVTDGSLSDLCSGPQHDRQNQRRISLWALAWAVSFLVVTHGIKKEWLSSGLAFAGVIATALLGIVTVLAYQRFLRETDELRRKIEVEALAFAFGAGVVAGLTYWLLVVSGTASGTGFAYVFAAMLLTHSLGVLLGRRKYS